MRREERERVLNTPGEGDAAIFSGYKTIHTRRS